MNREATAETFRASGKMMISSEYGALDGAVTWAVPTLRGQSLHLEPSAGPGLRWTSLDHLGTSWFHALWDKDGKLLEQNNIAVAETLHKLLHVAKELGANPFNGWDATTQLEFPNEWGLGSSSSLIALLSKWLNIPAFELFSKGMTGSGYDVAVALENQQVLFHKKDNNYTYETVNIDLPFKSQLYFVYSGQKQNSAKEVLSFHEIPMEERARIVQPLSELTGKMMKARSLEEFSLHMKEHEGILSGILKREPLQNSYPQLRGTVKHLGAWGGDFFLLATDDPRDLDYLKSKGIEIIFPWNEFIRSE